MESRVLKVYFAGDLFNGKDLGGNLMSSHFPRIKVLHINSMIRYHQFKDPAHTVSECLDGFYSSIASEAVSALDELTDQKSWISREQLLTQYSMAVKSMGGTMPQRFNEAELKKLVADKLKSGVY